MRSRTPEDFRGMCPRCYLKTAHCICGWLPRVTTRTEILIIRHVTEEQVMSNTGRLANLILSNCRIIDFGVGDSFDDSGIAEPGTWLLYPGPNPSVPRPAPTRLVVLDASFRRAKRMYKRIESLRRLPELALPPPLVIPHRLRQPPRPDGMSTIEAIAAGLAIAEDPGLGTVLRGAYTEFVRRADAAHGRLRPLTPT
jgi:DTW domain-containing protein